jgi:carboxymethylenebutenolidase
VTAAAGAPGVLLLHPWWGVTDAVRWWAGQLEAAGRRVLVPDLYDGALATTVEDAEARAQALLADPATPGRVARYADELAGEGRPWAAVGFSLGAFLACPLAARGAAAPAELVLFYGGQPPGPGEVGTRVVDVHAAPDDPFFEDEELAAVEEAFGAAGATVTVHRYEGNAHWFAEQGAPNHDPAATALARDRVLARLAVPA